MISYAQNFEDVYLARAFRGLTSGFDMDIGAMAFPVMPYDGVAEVYCPRRTVLDAILVDAAVACDAREQHRLRRG